VTNYIALAIPFFFVLILVELAVARSRKLQPYRFLDVVVNLASGTGQQVAAIFLAGGLLAIYAWLYDHARLFSLPQSSLWTWLLTFLLVDFKYYWWHRLSHEVNVLWAAHVVHHSSEDYNLAVALRQSVTTLLTTLPFALPLAILGVPPLVFVTLEAFSTLYQFWIHTELIDKLGWFETIFNTPAQHRVHHAVNPRYLDKNYAATLCIWDRLFGTFEEETEPPVYGLVHPLAKFDPLWAQVHYYVELASIARRAPRWQDKLLVWFKGPLWSPRGMPPVPPPPEVTRETRQKYEPPLGSGLRGYLWLQLVATMTGAFFLLLFQNQWPRQLVIAGALLVALSLVAWGGLMERRRWALPLELVRLALLGAVAFYFLSPRFAMPVLALILAGSLAPQLALLWGARSAGPQQA